jgi:hypothetical protein
VVDQLLLDLGGLVQQPAVEGLAQAEAVDGFENARWRYPFAIAALPAQQGLGTDAAAAGDVHLRLQMEGQTVIVLERLAQFGE